jgi:hypothetical protein
LVPAPEPALAEKEKLQASKGAEDKEDGGKKLCLAIHEPSAVDWKGKVKHVCQTIRVDEVPFLLRAGRRFFEDPRDFGAQAVLLAEFLTLFNRGAEFAESFAQHFPHFVFPDFHATV